MTVHDATGPGFAPSAGKTPPRMVAKFELRPRRDRSAAACGVAQQPNSRARNLHGPGAIRPSLSAVCRRVDLILICQGQTPCSTQAGKPGCQENQHGNETPTLRLLPGQSSNRYPAFLRGGIQRKARRDSWREFQGPVVRASSSSNLNSAEFVYRNLIPAMLEKQRLTSIGAESQIEQFVI